MNELRTLLQERAEVTDTIGPAARVGAVHDRVRAVRRRRRVAVTAAAVVAVVAAGVSVVPALVRSTPAPADRQKPAQLAGRTVPRTETAAGFTYDYAHGVQTTPGAKKLELTVRAADTPKLVMWATSSTDPAPVVRLTSTVGPEHFRSAAGGFQRYMLVAPKGTAHLTLTQRQAPTDNRLALAVYTLDHTPPPGISNGVATFRRTILDDHLVAGLIGSPGQTDLHTTVPARSGRVRISDLCYGAPSGDYVHVAFGGGQILGSSCGRLPDYDPGVGGGSFSAAQNPLPAHGPVHVHVWLTGKNGGAPSATSNAVIGFGLYRVDGATFRVAGQRLPVLQESSGHEYVERRVAQSEPGQRRLVVPVAPSEVPRLVTVVLAGRTGRGGVTLKVNGRSEDSFENDGNGASWGSGYVVQPGQAPRLAVTVTGRVGDTRVGLVLSDQVR